MSVNIEKKTAFRALYYPYSRCLYQTDLKRALLVFDELVFVDPLSSDITGRPGQMMSATGQVIKRASMDDPIDVGWPRFFSRHNKDVKKDWYDIVDTYEILKKHKIAGLVEPEIALQNHHQDILAYSFIRDFCILINELGGWGVSGSHKFYGLGARLGTLEFGWRVHSSRIPKPLVEISSNRDILEKCIEQTAEKKIGQHEIKKRVDSLEEILSGLSNVRTRAEGEGVVLPVEIAYLLILNQAFLLCEELQALPVTDDASAHQGLLIKLEKLYTSSETFVRDILPKPTTSELYQIQSFTLAVASRLIPDETLDRLSIDEVIAFRENNTNALHRFQEKMLEMSSEISSKPWQNDFNADIMRVIDSKVMPEVRQLDDELKDSYRRLFGTSVAKLGSEISKVVAPAIPTMTMATFLGLTPSQIVWIGAASLMSGLGIVLPDIVETWQERREHKRNGLSFLLHFRNSISA